jgi:hypothetical protein
MEGKKQDKRKEKIIKKQSADGRQGKENEKVKQRERKKTGK